MNRYNPTERLGVNETEKIVIQNLGWIFREQPIVDVGLDAIIEQVENGEPTGRFIAVQIKSGSGNFYKTQKGLSHYVTNIHYNYWLNLSIPIILIAHIPEEGKTYWQEITEKNFKKTKKRWKIDIPFTQEFNENSDKKLKKIASDKSDERLFNVYIGRAHSDDIEDIAEDLNSITDATFCINNISAIINLQSEDVQKRTEKLKLLTENMSLNYSSEKSKLYKALSQKMNLTSKRIQIEVELFAQVYSVGISAFEKLLNNLNNLNLKLEDFVENTVEIKNIPNSIDYAIREYTNLRQTLIEMPSYNFSFFKEAKKQQVEVLSLFLFELTEASQMTKKIFNNL
ncbi:DUF4365 domain-containing protein [Chryseobacterium indoltheticum]|uniref:DUF4365 domain-containing protein n=1 Tax=Chryseobacterium indoltheticum TaxID=254 RepID=A0A381FD75_9FLAO|nr:DUF4365 domain-containing protein [Chryseobacterium indoltheticum]AZA74005.1 DUF4365 domain-containing protein [Chryseobacterium indoltheticum]SIQ24143.1 protein of unknown function [Chryseobacterium indoltheticum]SUX44487.1 Uncharacterised protein [Chryseobacterium indoltheticum]